MPRHIIFDLDGTLVDSVGITVAIINEMFASRGIAQTACPITTRAHVSAGGEAMIAAVMGVHCTDPKADIAEFRRIHAETPTPPDTLFPLVVEQLAELAKAGFTLSICSNKPQNLCFKVLADLGIAHYFKVVVGSRDGLPKKPHPDLMQIVLASLDATPDDCMFIGDSKLDLQAAHYFDMKFVLVDWGYGDDMDHAPGGYDIVADMPALAKLAQRLRQGHVPA
jgi:phosphoglycolate phosphatase